MRVLVTGGAGFLGINLIRLLMEKGIGDIVCVDIAEFDYPERGWVRAIKCDIRDAALMDKTMEGIDMVVHTAAALPLYKKEDIYSIDVEGTRTVLDAALRHKVRRFIHISTTAVYGIPKKHPIYETDPLGGEEVGDYGRAKIMAEGLCREYRKKGMCVPILRPKSFIGPERLGIFALLYDWADSGKNFPIVGKGDNLFQLMDVYDLSEAIYACMTKDADAVNDTFNLGAKEFRTIREDFQAVLDYAGHGKKIVSFPVKPALLALELLHYLKLSPVYKWNYGTAYVESFVSMEKAEKVLGFKPKYSNKDALIRNYRWYLDNKNKFGKAKGVSHRVPWDQGIWKIAKIFF
ncbi:MAG: NAD(P)-dependent oxidoreductase [Candidatus Omnitrophica bacterium]|nr:NAD(P)-dependent oxidoreductase [Candidatus Omnitrophota bacterium]